MKKYNRFEIPVYSVLLAFCALFFYGTFIIKPGRAKTISDAFIPRLAIVVMAVLIIILLVNAVKNRNLAIVTMSDEDKKKVKEESSTFLKRFLFIVAILTVTLILMDTAGFVIAMSFYLLFLFIWLAEKKKRNWKLLIPMGILFPLVLFLVYLYGFSILLPAGWLEFIT